MKAFITSILCLISVFMFITNTSLGQWSFQTNPLGSGEAAMVGKVQFLSSSEGWINATGGHLLHTTNGGASWSIVTPFPNDVVFSISDPAFNMQFINASTGWVMKSYGTGFNNDASGAVIYHTTDGGNSWSKSIILQGAGIIGANLQFLDANNGFACVFNIDTKIGYLYKTTNGGANWTVVSQVPATDEVTLFNFVNATTGWITIINDNPAKFNISKTTDGGITWISQHKDSISHGVDTLESCGDMKFIDANNGWVVGPNSRILKTNNGGTTWIPITTTYTNGLNAYQKCLYVYDANHVWVGADLPDNMGNAQTHILIHTSDGGSTWSQDNISLTNTAFSIFFWDLNTGWLTSDLGVIAAYKDASSKTINITAGELASALSPTELSALVNLKITGTIDTRDFKTMRDNMPNLATIDLGGATISAYTGTDGTAGTGNITYAANEIPKYAFFYTKTNNGKESLTSVILPSSLSSIGYWAFIDTPNLIITIPANVTSIQEEAFDASGVINVESANQNYSSMNGSLFNKNQTLLMHVPFYTNSYTIPSSVTTIGVSAFIYNNNMTSISIPSTVTTIENYAFEYCSALSSINLSAAGLKSIGDYVFNSCKLLSSITLPTTLEHIGYCAFMNNPALSAFAIAGDNPYFSVKDGVLFNKDQTDLVFFPGGKSTDYQIPYGVTTIDTAAFEVNLMLQSLTIPSSVTKLSQEAFYWCTRLSSITIPASVNSIGKYAFYNCTSLNSFYADASTPLKLSVTDSIFINVNKSTCTLYVPSGSKSLYQAAEVWKDFTNIVEHTVTVAENPKSEEINVFIQNHQVVLTGVDAGENVAVYSILGQTIYNKKTESQTVRINLPANGIYLVRVGTKSFKLYNY